LGDLLRPNNGMHPTRDTPPLIISKGLGGRVMPGVRLLLRYQHSADGMRGRSGWRGSLVEAPPAMMDGLTSTRADGVGHDAGWMPVPIEGVA
jgi:hypothetical protein